MEYDFIFDRTTRQFSIRLAGEHEVLGRFLLDEFGQQAVSGAGIFGGS